MNAVSYLVRTEDDFKTTHLELFTGDEKSEVTAQDQLAQYLTSLIQVNRYAIGPMVAGIWEWAADDTRRELILELTAVREEMDGFSDEDWKVTDHHGATEPVTFTVRIDRKNQQ